MSSDQIVKYQAEIETLEKQIDSLAKQLEETGGVLAQKNSTLEQLKTERKSIEDGFRALGIFGFFKFKERKPLKEQLAVIVTKIRENENAVAEFRNKIDTLSQQNRELEKKIKTVQQEKERLQKEEKLKELAGHGDKQAQFDLAKFYFESKNEVEAMEWLRKAAEQGHKDAEEFVLQIERDQERIRQASHDVTLW